MVGGIHRSEGEHIKMSEGQKRNWNNNQLPVTDGGNVMLGGNQERDGGDDRFGQDVNKAGPSGATRVICNKCKDTRHATRTVNWDIVLYVVRRIISLMNVPGLSR